MSIVGNPITLGGGGGLSLEVVGSTTRPTSPKDNTIWVNSELPVTAVSLGPNEPCKRSATKNLLVYPFEKTTGTVNGVVYTDNGDGSVTANGTATADATFRLSFVTAEANLLHLEAGTYTLSGCPTGGSGDGYRVELKIVYPDLSGADLVADYGEGVTFTLDSPTTVRCNIVVSVGTTVSGLVFKPQLEKGTAATAFVKGDATGQVWVNTTNKYNSNGTNASTNILRVSDNPYLEINVLNISQWDGSAWVTRENSAIYANGAWTSMALWLFNYGTKDENYPFESVCAGATADVMIVNGSITYDTNRMLWGKWLAQGYYFGIHCTTPIDVSKYNSLRIINQKTATTTLQNAAAALSTKTIGALTYANASDIWYQTYTVGNTTQQDITYDISNLSGIGYFSFLCYLNGSTTNGTLFGTSLIVFTA